MGIISAIMVKMADHYLRHIMLLSDVGRMLANPHC